MRIRKSSDTPRFKLMLAALETVAKRSDKFTTDELHRFANTLGLRYRPGAWAMVLRRAKDLGWIDGSKDHITSTLSNRRRVRVWKSKIWGQECFTN